MSDAGSDSTNSNNDLDDMAGLRIIFNPTTFTYHSVNIRESDVSLVNQESNYTSGNLSFNSESSILESSSSQASGNMIKNTHPHKSWCIPKELYKREIGDYNNRAKWNIKFYQSEIAIKKLKISKQFKACDDTTEVETLGFNKTGDYLTSASDFTDICLWDWSREKCLTKISEAHSRRILETKFLNTNGATQIISCSSDGNIVLSSVNQCDVVSETLDSHCGRCSICVQNDLPYVFLSCGHDGTVKNIDIREPIVENEILCVQYDEFDCDFPLFGIDINPFNLNEFIVNGDDQVIRMYDKRKITQEPIKRIGIILDTEESKLETFHVTSAKYNYNGTEILANYLPDNVYLFDVNGPPNTYLRHYSGFKYNSVVGYGVHFYGPKSDYVVFGSRCGHIFILDKMSKDVVFRQHSNQFRRSFKLEVHPHLPILAVENANLIQIWEPLNECATSKVLDLNVESYPALRA